MFWKVLSRQRWLHGLGRSTLETHDLETPKTMFEQLKLRGKFGEVSRRLKISDDTHAIVWRGIGRYAKEMKRRGLDPDQALVFMLSDTIVNGAANGALEKIRAEAPQVYSDLRMLWVFCGQMLQTDCDRFGKAMMVPADHGGSPFDKS